MPGKVKVRVLAGRNLPVMDRSSDTTDAYVEVKLGSTTYKTDVCRKSLHPQWDSDWFKYEVDDSELQDEPLQIRLMDHDTYSANDAIGKVYVDLNPLLLPLTSSCTSNQQHSNSSNSDSSHPNVQAVPGAAGGGGAMMSGWIPVFDTMHGIRGEVNLVVKVELFSDFNKFRQSSCGVQFFCSGSIPEGYVVSRLQGLVAELVVEGDPEHQWIDKIRTPRASNEARQALFFKLSGELRRRIGLKAIELGANAVLGYQQSFDLEGETGIVVRGIGTAAAISKFQTAHHVHTQHHSPSPSPSPSPANQIINSTNQGPLDVSNNSINRDSSPQVIASPRSWCHSHFHIFPPSPGFSRHHRLSSASQSGAFSGSISKSGSPYRLSSTGYGLIRRFPSEDSVHSLHLNVSDGKDEDDNKFPLSENKMENENGNKNVENGDNKIKKKRGSSSERRSLAERLKVVKSLSKTVHGKLSRFWNNGGTNPSQSTNLYKRSMSDSARISHLDEKFSKSNLLSESKEISSLSTISEGGSKLLIKPNSYPGSTFQSVIPVEITIQSPKDEHDVAENFNENEGSECESFDLQLHLEGKDVMICPDEEAFSNLSESSLDNENAIVENKTQQKEVEGIIHSMVLETKELSNSDYDSGVETTLEKNCNLNQVSVKSDTETLKLNSPFCSKITRNSYQEQEIPSCIRSECLEDVEACENKVKDQVYVRVGEAECRTNQVKVSLGKKSSVLECKEPSFEGVIECIDTISPPLSLCFRQDDDKKSSPQTENTFDYKQAYKQRSFDYENSTVNYPIKTAKSDSYIAEKAKESLMLESCRNQLKKSKEMYDEDIIAQVCHLEELINQRNRQSPRTRLHSRNYDGEDLSNDCDRKPPTLEVSSWQDEGNISRDDIRSELTYSDGHLYSSSSDEDDDSSSCISFYEDIKMDEELPELEENVKSKSKSFLNTLAPKRLVKGYKTNKSKSFKHSSLTEKHESGVLSDVKSTNPCGEKPLLNKAIIKGVQKKLIPIISKRSVKDKTTAINDGTEEKSKKLSFNLSSTPVNENNPSKECDLLTKDATGNSPIDLLPSMVEQVTSSDLVEAHNDSRKTSQVTENAEESSILKSTDSLPHLINSPKTKYTVIAPENYDFRVNFMQTATPEQDISSYNRSSGLPELCTGVTMQPIHASPSSSTSSTSTLQCLCRTPVPGSTALEKPGSSPPSTGCQIKKNSGSTTDSHPCLHRRSSDSDLSVTPKANECPGIPIGNSSLSGSSGGVCGSSRDSTGNSSQWYHQSGSYPAGGYSYHPFHSHGNHWGMHHFPHLHHPLMGRVAAGANSGIAPDPLDMAEYPFLTMTSYPPGFILHLAGTVSARSVKLLSSGGDGGGGGSGGDEEAWEQRDAWWTEVRMEIRSHARALACDVVIAYSEKTSICDDVCVLSASGTAAVINPNYFYHGIGPDDSLRGVGSGQQCHGPHRDLMTSSLDRTDFEKEKGIVAFSTRGRNTSESRDVEEKGVTGSVGGTASSASPPQNPANIPLSSIQHCTTTSMHFPSCSICHIPYGQSTVPFRISMAKCTLCRRGYVPDVLLATCEPPEGLATIGVGSLIQAYASRGRRGEGGYGGGGSGGGVGMGGGGVVGVGGGSSSCSRGEISAKDISDGLPFLEYDLHRALANKLRLCGMNAVFGLKVEVRVGERLLVAIATGTGILVSALPRPTVPCIRPQSVHQGGQVSGIQVVLADALQKSLEETVKRCRDTFLLDPPKDMAFTNGTGRNGNSDTDDSGEDEHQHSLPQLDLSAGNKDTCVLEVDDDEDAEAIALLVAGPPLPPKGFHIAATERVPGLCYCPGPLATSTLSPSQVYQIPTCFSCSRPPTIVDPKTPLRVIRNLQMFSQIWRAKLSPPPTGSVIGTQPSGIGSGVSGSSSISQSGHQTQGTSNTSISLGLSSNITLHFNRLLQSIFFKLRKMAPCALVNLTFRVDLPEPDEIQLYAVGMALGLGERLPRRQRVHTTGGGSRESARKADDSEMIFSLEEEEEANLKDVRPPVETSTPKPTPMPSVKEWPPFVKTDGPRWAQWPLLGDRHGIEVTPLSYIPGGRIQRYLGNLNFFFIRESTCIREGGGLSGFVHSFMTEVLCIVRAHARALGGNALVAFSIAECVLLHNPHKNQGQSLINVSGDVVYASYEQD